MKVGAAGEEFPTDERSKGDEQSGKIDGWKTENKRSRTEEDKSLSVPGAVIRCLLLDLTSIVIDRSVAE